MNIFGFRPFKGRFNLGNSDDIPTNNDGTLIGAIKQINTHLIASNDAPFRFGYDSNTEQYGYIIDEGGADTFRPFKGSSDIYSICSIGVINGLQTPICFGQGSNAVVITSGGLYNPTDNTYYGLRARWDGSMFYIYAVEAGEYQTPAGKVDASAGQLLASMRYTSASCIWAIKLN